MDTLIDILAFLLIGIAVTPLLLLGLYALANLLGLAVADRILYVAMRLLQFQWLSGSVVNIAGGLAIGALGVWVVLHFEPLLHRLAGALLVPFGLWRAFRGAVLLKEFSSAEDQGR